MNNNYLVSICVPIYNVEKYIERCANSLFEQTYDNIEFVFINDCTPDKSIEILKETLDNFPHQKEHVKIINHETNKGIAVVRNSMINHCSGDFVFFVDSDDYIDKETISILVERQKKTMADIVSCHTIKHTNSGTLFYKEPEYPHNEGMLIFLLSQMYHHEMFGRLIRRSLFTHYNIHAKEGVNVGEDWQFMSQLVYYCHNISLSNHYLYHYNCMNANSYMAQKTSTHLNEEFIKQDIQAILAIIEFFDNKERKYRQIITQTGLRFCHEIMDKCIVLTNKTLFNHVSIILNSDPYSFYRHWWQRQIDNSYLLYKTIYYLRYLKAGIIYKYKQFFFNKL